MKAEYYFNKKIKTYLNEDSTFKEIIEFIVKYYKSDNYYIIFDKIGQDLGFSFFSAITDNNKFVPTLSFEPNNKLNKEVETEMLYEYCDLKTSYEIMAKEVLYLLLRYNLKKFLINKS